MTSAVITEDELRTAVIGYAEAWANSEPSEGEDHVFSARYEEQKKRVIALASKVRLGKGRHRMLRKIASLLIVAALAFGIIMAVSPKAFAAVRSWSISIYNKLVDYIFDHTGSDQARDAQEPSWLPNGYKKTDDIESDTGRIIVYTDAANDSAIVLNYSKMEETDLINIDHLGEDIDPEEVLIKGIKCHFYPATENSGGSELVWVNEAAGLVIVINSELSREDVVRLAESIVF